MAEMAMNAAEFERSQIGPSDSAESGTSSVPEVPDSKWWAVKDANLGRADYIRQYAEALGRTKSSNP
jgi:hypothetical protein